jgi:hypothetical protein
MARYEEPEYIKKMRKILEKDISPYEMYIFRPPMMSSPLLGQYYTVGFKYDDDPDFEYTYEYKLPGSNKEPYRSTCKGKFYGNYRYVAEQKLMEDPDKYITLLRELAEDVKTNKRYKLGPIGNSPEGMEQEALANIWD